MPHEKISLERFIMTRGGGELVVRKLIAFHSRSDGTETEFDIHRESDGSQRVMICCRHSLKSRLRVPKKCTLSMKRIAVFSSC